MPPRVDLHNILVNLLGSQAVYFQPPPSVKMTYPCIVYSRNTAITIFADNSPYRYEMSYKVTVIDPDPDSLIPDKIAHLDKCVFQTNYTVDNLNHDVFSLYF